MLFVVIEEKTEKFVDENRSSLTYGIGGVAALIVAVLAYQSFIAAPAEAQAEESSWQMISHDPLAGLQAFSNSLCTNIHLSATLRLSVQLHLDLSAFLSDNVVCSSC